MTIDALRTMPANIPAANSSKERIGCRAIANTRCSLVRVSLAEQREWKGKCNERQNG